MCEVLCFSWSRVPGRRRTGLHRDRPGRLTDTAGALAVSCCGEPLPRSDQLGDRCTGRPCLMRWSGRLCEACPGVEEVFDNWCHGPAEVFRSPQALGDCHRGELAVGEASGHLLAEPGGMSCIGSWNDECRYVDGAEFLDTPKGAVPADRAGGDDAGGIAAGDCVPHERVACRRRCGAVFPRLGRRLRRSRAGARGERRHARSLPAGRLAVARSLHTACSTRPMKWTRRGGCPGVESANHRPSSTA